MSRARRPSRSALRAALVAAVAGLLLMVGGQAASATDPLTLTGDLTDQVDALGGDTAAARAALDSLAQATDYRLYVVFVDTFSGAGSPEEWVQATAAASGLGGNDFMLAVAIGTGNGDGRFFLAPGSAGPVEPAEVSAVAEDVRNDLENRDFGQAVVTAAQGLQAAALGSTAGGSSPGFGTVLLVGLLVIAAVAILAAVAARRRRPGAAHLARGKAAPDEYEGVPTAELDRRSSRALVGIDDALRSSEQELGFAQAQFGEDATRQFEQVLAAGKQRVTEAFRLRQSLDDEVPDTEATVRATAVQILRLCDQTADELDEQKDAFDALRSVQERVGDALDAHDRAATALAARIDPARAQVATLQARYPASSLASIAGNPEQAQALLVEVASTIAEGRACVEAGDRAQAVQYARAAEAALDQVRVLLDGVDSAGDELASAPPRLAAAVASISGDLQDAARLAPAHPDVAPRVREARDAVAAAQAAATGQGDPLAALRRIAAAEAAIDAALAPMREQAERARRAVGLLDETLGRLDSAIRATTAYVDTRRGAVGPQARTRLAEADRLRRQAMSLRGTNPHEALAAAQRGEQLVTQAQQLAQADVEREGQNRHGPGQGGGNNLGGMILGGILIDSILRGGGERGGGHRGGGFGAGGFGGGWGGGGGGRGGGGGFGGGF